MMCVTNCPSVETLSQHLEADGAGEEQRQIADHVETCHTCQITLQTLLCSDTLVTSAFSTPAAAIGVGEPRIAGYEILGELGRGGMGVVYKARDLKLGRLVALKTILAGAHAGPQELQRFRTEAEAAARLQHPNIIQIHEVGTYDGRAYLALEFCPGGGLDRKLREAPLAPMEAARLVETLARAIDTAHSAGVVHRDLKPANVLFAADGTPKVADFGLAKQLDQEAGQTATGAIVGTPSYMAPEQATGKAGVVGPAVDVYALGALLYECLTGRPPFKAATPLDTLAQVLHDEPVPPRQLQSKVPRDLETITLKCLRKEAGKRYSSALELAEDLQRLQAGLPVKARPVGVLERTWRWCGRNRAVAGLLGAVAATLLIGALTASYFAIEAGKNADRLEAVLSENVAIRRRGVQTTVWFLKYLKDNPELANLSYEDLFVQFRLAHPDVTDADLIGAFVPPVADFPPVSSAGLGETFRFDARMFGS
ncbi:MAG TPA: serine/threonine-protein kinase [Gemmataceae bacterium]|nr:serine/threonine-protein kinase [Gemmataceae bacterium]